MTQPKETDGPTADTSAASEPDRPEANEQDATKVLDDLNELRAKAEERDQFLQMLQRTRADFENYQKRVRRDLQQERQYALAPLLADLLPIIDNLERALASVQEDSPLRQGVAMVRDQFLDLLKRHHVVRIEAEGEPFDPHRHEAVMQRPTSDVPPNTVIQVVEPGYLYHERVLRPSKVVVSTQADKDEPA